MSERQDNDPLLNPVALYGDIREINLSLKIILQNQEEMKKNLTDHVAEQNRTNDEFDTRIRKTEGQASFAAGASAVVSLVIASAVTLIASVWKRV